MTIKDFSFGTITVDGRSYDHDIVIDRGVVHKRRKKASKAFRAEFGHTPLSTKERIPWDCKRLVVGTGANGNLSVMDAVREEAQKRHVDLVVVPTAQAIAEIRAHPRTTNAILHLTC